MSTSDGGALSTESRDVSGFDRVTLSGVGTMRIERGDAESLEIETHADLLPSITTEVTGGTLRIGLARKAFLAFRRLRRQDIRYRVTVRELRGLSLSGAGEIGVGPIAPEAFELKVSGAGDVNLESIETGQLAVSISGAGDCSLAGKADSLDVVVSGAGDLDAASLESRVATVKISGAGDVRLWARETLAATVTGAGSIRYRGEPDATKTITGVGSIRKLDDTA